MLKKYTSRAKKFPAPANQRPKELRPHFLPYRCQANFERHVPLFNGAWFGGLRYRSMWAPDDQQPHQDFCLARNVLRCNDVDITRAERQ